MQQFRAYTCAAKIPCDIRACQPWTQFKPGIHILFDDAAEPTAVCPFRASQVLPANVIQGATLVDN